MLRIPDIRYNYDCFYIHPTTKIDGNESQLTNIFISNQASVFNGIASVFIPLYDQVSIGDLVKPLDELRPLLDKAYNSVKDLFLLYLTQYNQGRRFFILSHSQGSYHAFRLMQEIWMPNLMAAIIPGAPFPANLVHILNDNFLCAIETPYFTNRMYLYQWETFGHEYMDFKEWNRYSYHWNRWTRSWYAAPLFGNYVSNPVSWNIEMPWTTRAMHIGALGFAPTPDQFYPHRLDAWINEYNKVIIGPKLGPEWFEHIPPIYDEGVYHVFDINLFWADIRDLILWILG